MWARHIVVRAGLMNESILEQESDDIEYTVLLVRVITSNLMVAFIYEAKSLTILNGIIGA
jgi:hypothetical protein